MPAIITPSFRVSNALLFAGAVDTDNNRLYITIGRSLPWEGNDIDPPTPGVGSTALLSYWRDMIAAKRVTGSDVIMGARRINWASGTVYVPFSAEMDPEVDAYYVMNAEYNVYKCIDNFGGAVSAFTPQGQTLSIISTADGYKWKYVGSVSASDATRFLTVDYLPIRENAVVKAAAQGGTIDSVQVTEPGTGYTNATVAITGDGVGATATAVVLGGQVIRINVTNPGTGYSFANATITGDGVGATAEAVVPPIGGHGADVLSELGCYNVLVSNLLEPGLANFPVDNDYRRVMYVQNPAIDLTDEPAVGLTYNLTHGIIVQHVSGSTTIADDEVVTGSGSGATFNTIEQIVDGPTTTFNIVYSSQDRLVNGDTFTTAAGGIWEITNAASREPLWRLYSGLVTFIDHRRAIMRSDDQIENLITVFEF